MDTIRRMAEQDPYWRGVRDALEDRYGFTSAPESNEHGPNRVQANQAPKNPGASAYPSGW